MSRIGSLALVMSFVMLSIASAHPTASIFAQGTPENERGFEVWLIDQSDSNEDGGGTLHVFPDASLIEGVGEPEVIDLGLDAADLCFEQTASYPRRPHMLLFNEAHNHAVLAYVATGHVLFFDAVNRTPLTCIDVGQQAHAAYATPDQNHVIVANQNGKLLQRISTDYATNEFVLDDAATVDLATCVTPSGAACEDPELRPDNAPICPIVDSSSTFSFVTLRGGGLLVFDLAATPMAIVAEYDNRTINPNGCGGLEVNDKVYLNSGGGLPTNPFQSDLYSFPLAEFSTTPASPNTPTPTVVFDHNDRERADSHGAVLAGDGAYLWVADRAGHLIVVVDTESDQVVNEIDLSGDLSDRPAPDLISVSPDGQWVFISLRGPNPLTANSPEHHNAEGSNPGVAVIRVQDNGTNGEVTAVVQVTNIVGGAETADPHGIEVRRVS